jgi:hypothetical protein
MFQNNLNTIEITTGEHSPITIDGIRVKGIQSFSIVNTMDINMVILEMKMVVNLKDGECKANVEAIIAASQNKDKMKEAPTVPVQELNVNSRINRAIRTVFQTNAEHVDSQFKLAVIALILALVANAVALFRLFTI